MRKKNARLIIAAVVIAQQIGSPAAAAVPSDAVNEIRTMVQSGNAEALRTYLSERPSLLEDEGPLARALSEFLDRRGGILEILGFRGDAAALEELADVAFQSGIY